MSNLSQGWNVSTLGEICSKPQYGWTSKAAHSGELRYVRTTDISNGKINWEKVPFCSKIPDDIKKYKIRKDDILVSRAGSVGVSYRIKRVPFDAVFASYLIRFKPTQNINPKYIEYYLKSDEYWKSISDFTAGIAIPNVNASKLSQLKIPLAPENEQCRIVAKLEKLLQKVDACTERLDKIPTILKRFRQSVLAAACSGRLTADWREKNPETEPGAGMLSRIKDKGIIGDTANSYDLYELPKNWSWLRIIDIGDVKGGKRLPKGEKLVRINTGFPYIKAGFLKEGTVVTDNLEYLTPEVREKIKRYTVTDGDVYITIVGACIGDAGVIPKKLDGANLTENAAKICNTEGVNNHYLANWLRSTVCQDFIKRTILSAAQGKLALGRIKMLPVPIPPPNEQQEIVRRIEALFKITDQIEDRYKKARTYVDKLSQSILSKAFRGELVPQDPNDEPASELLKRIKAGLTINKAKKKTGRMAK